MEDTLRLLQTIWLFAFVVHVVISAILSRVSKRHFLGNERQWMGEGDIDPALFTAQGRRWLRISRWYGLIGFALLFGWLALMQ